MPGWVPYFAAGLIAAALTALGWLMLGEHVAPAPRRTGPAAGGIGVAAAILWHARRVSGWAARVQWAIVDRWYRWLGHALVTTGAVRTDDAPRSLDIIEPAAPSVPGERLHPLITDAAVPWQPVYPGDTAHEPRYLPAPPVPAPGSPIVLDDEPDTTEGEPGEQPAAGRDWSVVDTSPVTPDQAAQLAVFHTLGDCPELDERTLHSGVTAEIPKITPELVAEFDLMKAA